MGRLQVSEATHDTEINELVEIIWRLHRRFGKPHTVSLLDRCIHFGGRPTSEGLDRYAFLSVDTKLLHYSSWTAGGGGEIDVYFHGNEPIIQGTWDQIRTRINDLASDGEGA